LSGGERQRVAIARALANDPPLVLADEPTGNLDEKTGNDVMRILTGLVDSGRTVVMVTHNPAYERIVDRVIRLHDGLIVEDRPGGKPGS
jgi:putative ABC transport system ATP-binding protein